MEATASALKSGTIPVLETISKYFSSYSVFIIFFRQNFDTFEILKTSKKFSPKIELLVLEAKSGAFGAS